MQKLTDRLDSLNHEKQLLTNQLEYIEEITPVMSIEEAKEKLCSSLEILDTATQEAKKKSYTNSLNALM